MVFPPVAGPPLVDLGWRQGCRWLMLCSIAVVLESILAVA